MVRILENLKFPQKTLEKMIRISKNNNDNLLTLKLVEIKSFDKNFKKNRWFGYYQRVGEEKGYWKLEEIISSVIEERRIEEKSKSP